MMFLPTDGALVYAMNVHTGGRPVSSWPPMEIDGVSYLFQVNRYLRALQGKTRSQVESVLSIGLTSLGAQQWWNAENERLGMDTPSEAWEKGRKAEVFAQALLFVEDPRYPT